MNGTSITIKLTWISKFQGEVFLCFFFLGFFSLENVNGNPPDSLKNKRLAYVIAGTSVVYGGTLIGLNELWYKGYNRSPFHFINDNEEWLQMDKMGHMFTSYYEGVMGTELLKWCGLERKKAIWYGGMSGFLLQTPIEILDGFSEKWGASPGDLIANATGSALFISQELLWDEQKIKFKFSFYPSDYAKKNKELLGKNVYQQMIKDYNAQTYWASIGIYEFFPGSKIPKWLDVSLGYGADGLIGGFKNPAEYENTKRIRQYYLSLDLDLTEVKTKSKTINTFFTVISFIKIPAPAMEYNSSKGIMFHAIYF